MEHRLVGKLRPVFSLKEATTYSSLVPLDEWFVLKATNETSFADGKRKLVGLGWEDRRLGEDILGWANNNRYDEVVESLPAKLVERYVRRHRDVLNSHLAGVDTDQMSEGELRKLICAMESGAKVVSVPTADRKTKLCVSVLSLGPNGVRSTITAEKRERPSEDTAAAASQRGVEVKVNISQIFISP